MLVRTPVRDKTTWVSYFQATCFAWFVFGFGATLPLLRDDLHLSTTTASFHSIFMAIGSITAGFTGGPFVARVGRGRVLQLSSIVFATGVTLYVSGHSLAVTLPAVALTTFGGSTIIQATAAYLSNHQGVAAPTAISEMHALAAGLGIFAPILVGIGLSVGVGWRPAIMVTAISVLILEFVRGRNTDLYGPATHGDQESSHHDVPGPLPKRFWWTWAVMLCTASTEFSMLLWASDVLRIQGGLGKAASAASLGCVVGGMFVGRFFGSQLAIRINSEKLFLGSLVLALVGFLGFWQSHSAILLMVMLAITGLGVSLHFPLGIDRALRASEGRQDRASGLISVGAGFASGAAPFALGAWADRTSVHTAYAIVPIALTIAVFITARVRIPLDQ